MHDATLTTLDKRIIRVSKELFLSKGIMKTEMKEIAKLVGVSRSTLYRHFPQALDIAFYIAEDVLRYWMAIDYAIPGNLSGYERFSLYMHKFLEKMWNNLNTVQFINEFDTLYNLKYSTANPPAQYVDYLSNQEDMDFFQVFRTGIQDGSIRREYDELITPRSFVFTAISMTKHIMLREENYLSEHGFSREFIFQSIDLMLTSIKADQK